MKNINELLKELEEKERMLNELLAEEYNYPANSFSSTIDAAILEAYEDKIYAE